MKKLFKKIVSSILALALLVTFIPLDTLKVEATNRTVNDAVEWIMNKADTGRYQDVDGEYGCQCVDLIMAYYEYLGYPRCSGNARDYYYGSHGIPAGSGWYKDNIPSPGAIIVWPGYTWTGAWTTGENGHIGLVYSVEGSTVYTVETNVTDDAHSGMYGYANAKKCTRYPEKAIYIHPDFPGTTPPSPIESEAVQPSTYFIVSTSDGKALTLGNNEDYNTNNIHMYDTNWTNRGQHMVIYEAPDGYKIRPTDSSRLVNPYGDYAASGENINIYADVNDNSQWWKFQKVDGGYVIRNVQNPNLVIDNSQSDNAVLWEYNGGDNQIWELIPAVAPGKPVITNVKSSYEVSESVVVKWNNTSDTNQYNIALEKKTNGEYKQVYWKENVSSGYNLNSVMTLDPGDYRVRVAAVNTKLPNGDYYLSTISDFVNFTVKAKAQTYTIAFNANGGTGSMANVTMTYGVAKNLPANTFTRTGYTFLGWSKDKNATTATYADKQSVKNLATSGTVTLYAVWKKNASTIGGNLDISARTENKAVIAEIRFSMTDTQYGLQAITYTVQFDPKVLKYSEDSYFPYASTNVNTKRANEGIVIVTTILTADPNESFSSAYLSTMLFDIITSDPCTTSINVSANDAYGAEGTEITTSGTTVNISLNEFKLGDINGDGKVNSLDALWALQAASENRALTSTQFLAADVNRDEKVNSLDALWILQAASGNRQL